MNSLLALSVLSVLRPPGFVVPRVPCAVRRDMSPPWGCFAVLPCAQLRGSSPQGCAFRLSRHGHRRSSSACRQYRPEGRQRHLPALRWHARSPALAGHPGFQRCMGGRRCELTCVWHVSGRVEAIEDVGNVASWC
jgi:hypothetical protein